MSQAQDLESARYGAGLELLARLAETGSALSGEEASDLLGTRTAKGIGAAFSGTGMSLGRAGIRPDEAVCRRTVSGGLLWTAGPRLCQTRHVLEQARRYRMKGACEEVPLKEPPAGDMRPVLALRAIGSRGNACRFDGSLAERAASLDDSLLDIPDDDIGSIGETFVRRIEPGRDGGGHPVPESYGENGNRVRGEHDYTRPRVAGALGTGRFLLPSARVGEAHRARAGSRWSPRRAGWKRSAPGAAGSPTGAILAGEEVGDGTRIRHGERVGAPDSDGRWSAPPLQARALLLVQKSRSAPGANPSPSARRVCAATMRPRRPG